jgi:tetratricopeptide (TPR) repeat protein
MRARDPGLCGKLAITLCLLAMSATAAAVSLATISVPPDTREVDVAIERARKALLADKYVEAGKAVEEALQKRGFLQLSKLDQFRAVLLASEAARGREDYLAAHEFMAVATDYPDAKAEHWVTRAHMASWVDAWGDAGIAITKVAKDWPASLADIGVETIQWTAMKMDRDEKLAADRLTMINALFAAKFQLEWHIEPSGLWNDLLLDALARKDMVRAREVLARIEDPGALALMRIDRRYDELVKSEPKSFDVAAAAQAQARRLRREVDANPRMLRPVVQYMYALFVIGEYQEALALADRSIEKHNSAPLDKPAFDDVAKAINWIYDLKSRALRGMGRWDESLVIQEEARRQQENSNDKVSQAINLGFSYNARGRPEDALKSLEGIDWARSLSGYGRMQLQHVRLHAYLQLGNRAEAEKVFVYLREHRLDAPNDWQEALLDWGDVEGAAAHYIARLRDPEQRAPALLAAQTFMPLPRLPREAEEIARWEAMLARRDVTEAINEVGRRGQMPLYSISD